MSKMIVILRTDDQNLKKKINKLILFLKHIDI